MFVKPDWSDSVIIFVPSNRKVSWQGWCFLLNYKWMISLIKSMSLLNLCGELRHIEEPRGGLFLTLPPIHRLGLNRKRFQVLIIHQSVGSLLLRVQLRVGSGGCSPIAHPIICMVTSVKARLWWECRALHRRAVARGCRVGVLYGIRMKLNWGWASGLLVQGHLVQRAPSLLQDGKLWRCVHFAVRLDKTELWSSALGFCMTIISQLRNSHDDLEKSPAPPFPNLSLVFLDLELTSLVQLCTCKMENSFWV